jgi:hypothetical protein
MTVKGKWAGEQFHKCTHSGLATHSGAKLLYPGRAHLFLWSALTAVVGPIPYQLNQSWEAETGLEKLDLSTAMSGLHVAVETPDLRVTDKGVMVGQDWGRESDG